MQSTFHKNKSWKDVQNKFETAGISITLAIISAISFFWAMLSGITDNIIIVTMSFFGSTLFFVGSYIHCFIKRKDLTKEQRLNRIQLILIVGLIDGCLFVLAINICFDILDKTLLKSF